jgi:hypothetical protein
LDGTDQTIVRTILRGARNFAAGYLLAWLLFFLSRLATWRPDFHDLLPNWGMAVYMAMVTAVPAGIGFGLVAALSIAPGELAPRRFLILSVLAGAVAFAVNFAGALMPYVYYHANRLGTLGGVFALLAPGLVLGLLLVAVLRIGARIRST